MRTIRARNESSNLIVLTIQAHFFFLYEFRFASMMISFREILCINIAPCRTLVIHFVLFFGGALIWAGCDNSNNNSSVLDEDNCNIPVGEVFDGGVGKDGIPSLQNPSLVDPAHPSADYLDPDSRIIGIILNGVPVAVPHNILWWHEIVNLDSGNEQVAVSYCPLTGSSITFDRASHGGATFGVSGLLWQNNLIMYDRSTQESLWPQMLRQAGCGSDIGQKLTPFPATELTWAGWKALYPDTKVISSNTGFFRSYVEGAYPYGTYERPDNGSTLFPQNVNSDRPPKERVLGIPDGDGGKLYPFFELDNDDALQAVNDVVNGRPLVVFWEDASDGAVAFDAIVDGMQLTFSGASGIFKDLETSSTWDLSGRAVAGDLVGAQLEPVAEAYVAFWFAWKAFHPESEVWIANGTN